MSNGCKTSKESLNPHKTVRLLTSVRSDRVKGEVIFNSKSFIFNSLPILLSSRLQLSGRQ